MLALCEFCDKLGHKVSVDYLEDEKFPPEASQLVKVPGGEDRIFRCPLCGQPYAYDQRYDNDIYNQYDYGELYRIDEPMVTRILAANKEWAKHEKQKIKSFKRKARKKFGPLLARLSTDESRVFEYLLDKMIWGEYLRRMTQDLAMDEDVLLGVLDRLEKSGLVKRRIYYPLRPGKYNFQEEVTDVDPLEYTKISIDML